ncbi:YIF1-domain-containing protein [Hortaea werneckii]|nr:YIF1-domain-containing protein [Hortaea werneckii]KAI7624086.1 YIF1-domain-containing protein [Hortaea werneckii]
MQRPPYNPGIPPANSPPLHHPVPQHVSTVPQLRSPPPPSQSANSYGYGQPSPAQGAATGAGGMGGAQGAGGFMHPAFGGAGGANGFGGFINDPTAQMGLQMGQGALKVGQEYMEQNFNRYVNVSQLKHYFNVSNSYVLTKLYIVLFPWRHRPWSRQQSRLDPSARNTDFLPPREDINSPDMYIPLMSFTTYILLSTLLAGLNGRFEPQLLGITFSNASVIILLELLVLWGGKYFLNIESSSQIYDLVAYSGYKFVGVIVTIAVSALWNKGVGTGGWVGWGVFGYAFLSNAFFLLRSLKYVLLPPDNHMQNPIARGQRARRTQFLFVYSYVVQFAFMWWLTALEFGKDAGAKKAA